MPISYKLFLKKTYKPFVFILCLLPAAILVQGAINNELGVNPSETMTRTTGAWALYFIIFTLSITPLRQLLHWGWLTKFRRMLGLYAFFYACLHLLTYIWFDKFFDWNEIVKDIIKRPFITIGFMTFLLLTPLSFTSTKQMMQRLKKNWKKLHQLIYPVAILGVLHYFLMTKADYKQPLIFLVAVIVLLAYRFFRYIQKTKKFLGIYVG